MILVLAIAATAVGCGAGSNTGARAQAPSAMPVKVEVAHDMPVQDTTDYVATLKSRDSAVIMPQVDGVITEIYVHSGERVKAGTALLQIDQSKQQATVRSQEDARAAQEANLKYAKQQYDRVSGLYAAGVVSKQELDQAKTALDAAQAQLQSLEAQVHEQRVQLRYYHVDASRAGIIGDIPVRVGDRVTTSTTLTTVDKPGSLEAYVYVPVERSQELKRNLPVQLVDSEGKVLEQSRITFISPQVDNTTQTILVKSAIADSKLRTSQFVRARLIWGTRKQPMVPILAVSRVGAQFFAFVAEPDKNGSFVARQRPLRVGQMVGNHYTVLEGVKPGDRVIVSGTQFLVDGMPVAPQT